MNNDLICEALDDCLSEQVSRYACISYLRIFSTICVVWLHTCSTLCENKQLFDLNMMQNLFFSASYQMMYWAVPVFFMITGMLFLRPQMHIGAKDCVFKYGRRILASLFVFGIPFAALKILTTEGMSISLIPQSFMAVVTDTGFGHLWYLYVLIGIYSIMPVLKIFCDKASDNELLFVLITLFAFDFFFPLISRLTNCMIAFSSQLLYPTFYVLLGHWLFENRLRFDRKMLWLVTFTSILLIWILNALNLKLEVWVQYDSPLIVALASSIFSLFITRDWKNTSRVWELDRLCFGVYLIHPLFIQFTYRFLKVIPTDFSFYPAMTVLFATSFAILSFTTTWIMRKIGILKRYVL